MRTLPLSMAWMPDTRLPLPCFQRDQVIAEVGPHADEAGNLVLLVKVLQLLGQRQVGETIAVVGQKFLFALEILLHRLQPLSDVGIDARVREGNAPVVNIAVQQFQVLGRRRTE